MGSSWIRDQTCVPHTKADSYPLCHQGSPRLPRAYMITSPQRPGGRCNFEKTFVNQSISFFEFLDVMPFSEGNLSGHLVFRECPVKRIFCREISIVGHVWIPPVGPARAAGPSWCTWLRWVKCFVGDISLYFHNLISWSIGYWLPILFLLFSC